MSNTSGNKRGKKANTMPNIEAGVLTVPDSEISERIKVSRIDRSQNQRSIAQFHVEKLFKGMLKFERV